MTTTNDCGDCSACCKLMGVTELDKPACVWCVNAKPGKLGGACSIYAGRPQSCADFKCLWLQTQEATGDRKPMPISMRPDKSKVMFLVGGNERGDLILHVDPGFPRAWKEDRDIMQLVNNFLEKKREVLVICGEKRSLFTPHMPTTQPSARHV